MPSKKCKIVFFLILTNFLLVNTAHASQINTHSVVLSLDKEGLTHAEVTLDYAKLTTNKVYYLLFSKVSNLNARDASGKLSCEIQSLAYGTQIACQPNALYAENYTVTLSFDIHDLQRKRDNTRIFLYEYSIKDTTKFLKVKLVLPPGSALIETDELKPFYPEDGIIGSTGREIVIEWSEEELRLGKTYTFSAIFEIIGGDSWFMDYKFIAVAVIVILILLIALKFKPKKETILSVLKDDERAVLDVLLDYDGKCTQRDIVKRTDFSKARVSRIINNLEERKLIRKEPRGRTNVIYLSKNVK